MVGFAIGASALSYSYKDVLHSIAILIEYTATATNSFSSIGGLSWNIASEDIKSSFLSIVFLRFRQFNFGFQISLLSIALNMSSPNVPVFAT